MNVLLLTLKKNSILCKVTVSARIPLLCVQDTFSKRIPFFKILMMTNYHGLITAISQWHARSDAQLEDSSFFCFLFSYLFNFKLLSLSTATKSKLKQFNGDSVLLPGVASRPGNGNPIQSNPPGKHGRGASGETSGVHTARSLR